MVQGQPAFIFTFPLASALPCPPQSLAIPNASLCCTLPHSCVLHPTSTFDALAPHHNLFHPFHAHHSGSLDILQQLVAALSCGATACTIAGAGWWAALVAALLKYGIGSSEAQELLAEVKSVTAAEIEHLGEWDSRAEKGRGLSSLFNCPSLCFS